MCSSRACIALWHFGISYLYLTPFHQNPLKISDGNNPCEIKKKKSQKLVSFNSRTWLMQVLQMTSVKGLCFELPTLSHSWKFLHNAVCVTITAAVREYGYILQHIYCPSVPSHATKAFRSSDFKQLIPHRNRTESMFSSLPELLQSLLQITDIQPPPVITIYYNQAQLSVDRVTMLQNYCACVPTLLRSSRA